MDDQALHVSHIGQQGEDAQMVDEAPSLVLSALDLEGEDASGSVGEEFLIERMVRMVGE